MEEMDKIPEEDSLVTFVDEDGEEITLEFLDSIEYEGKEYLCLLPTDENSSNVVILEVEPIDEENEHYLTVDDEAILEGVYAIFKEHFKDIFNFED